MVVEVNCETDFVGRSEDFIALRQRRRRGRRTPPPRRRSKHCTARQAAGGKTDRASCMNDLLAKVGEKIDVRRFEIDRSRRTGSVSAYTHLGSKIGVLVEFDGP